RSGRDKHLAIGVDVEVVEPALVRGDRLSQLRNAGARRVLITPSGHDRVSGCPGDLARAVGVGKALAQVDRAGGDGQFRHLGENRGPQAREPSVQQRTIHLAMTSRLAAQAVRTSATSSEGARIYPGLMRAWAVHKPGRMASGPLVLLERPVPEPG